MTAWRWAVVGAALTIAVGMLFPLVPDIDACGPTTGAGQWITFQTINSVADVQAMIRPDCVATFVPALRQSMWLDALAFIPAYTLLLASAIVALRPPRWLMLTGLAALAGGVIADQLEGVSLLAILNNLPGTEVGVQNVVLSHIAKKFLLALATGLTGAALLPRAGWRRLAGAIVLLGGLAAMANAVLRFAGGETALLVSWLMLTAVVIAGAVAESRQSRSGAQDLG